jgi:two-component system, sensor histidine kinase and response regulator
MVTALIIDDNPVNCEMIAIALKRINIDSSSVTNGNAALSHLETHTPDLIVTDLCLPNRLGPDGTEIIAHIRGTDRLQHLPIIAVTAISDAEYEQRAMTNGADELIRRPFKLQDLAESAQRLLGISANTNT